MANSRTTKHTAKQIAKQETEIPVTMVTMDDVKDKVIILRDEPILLDRDVAKLYDVQTREINQAVKNNPKKFPTGYLFTLDDQETADLRSKILIANPQISKEEIVSWSKVRYNPIAFTERGLYMLATILKGERAIETTLAIIDTFASVKELTRTIKALNEVESKEEQKGLLKRSGELMGDIIGNDMITDETETELELNFAVLKVKHTIKRKKKK